jgi:hypothetical protein
LFTDCSLCVSKSKILTVCHKIGNHTVHLLIFKLRLNGFTAIIGLHSVIQYHSIIVAFGDFLENFVNNSFGHFSAQTIAKRKDSSWPSPAICTIQFKNVGVEATTVDLV